MKCSRCGAENGDLKKYCGECGASLKEGAVLETFEEESINDVSLDELKMALSGRYEIIGEIGRGGMGIVYHARELSLDRDVAIKVLPRELSFDGHFRERFKREVKTLAKLKHQNIVTLYSADEAGGFIYFTMEYVDGKTLSEYINEKGKLTEKEIYTITSDICAALEHAHKKEILHRDLSPDNVMIDKEGNVYVMDFGIAKALSGTKVTRTGATMGKAAYMSPEQCMGEELDARSDIYSLGVMMYQMACGELPFDGEPVSIMYRHVNEEPRTAVKVNSSVPADLARVIMICLSKKREKRPAGAAELIKMCGVPEHAVTSKKPAEAINNIFKKNFITRNIKRAAVAMAVAAVIPAVIYFVMKPVSLYSTPGDIRLKDTYNSDFVMSKDASAAGYLSKNSSGKFYAVIVTGKEERSTSPYDEIRQLKVGNGGKHYCFAARKDKKWFVVYDGKEGQTYAGIADLSLSDNGEIMAYRAAIGTVITETGGFKGVVIYDKQVSTVFDYINNLSMSSDGKHYITRVGIDGKWNEKGNYIDGKYHILYDGKESEAYDYVWWPTLSQDGKRYTAGVGIGGKWDEKGDYIEGKRYILYNGKKSEAYDYVWGPGLSHDGKHYIAEVGIGGKWTEKGNYIEGKYHILYDGKESGAYDYVSLSSLSLDQKHHIAKAGIGGKWNEKGDYIEGKWYILYDGKKSEAYDYVGEPSLSQDGKHYITKVGIGGKRTEKGDYIEGKWYILYDGKKSEAYDYVGEPSLSHDGKHYIARVAIGGKWTEKGNYIEGKRYILYDGIKSEAYDYVGEPSLSQDGKHYIAEAGIGGKWTENGNYIKGKYHILYDGIKSEAYDYVWWPTLSQDGKHYITRVGIDGKWNEKGNYIDGKYHILYDGKESDAYDYVGKPSLSQDGKHYIYRSIRGGYWLNNGVYESGKDTLYKNSTIVEKDVYWVYNISLKGYSYEYSVRKTSGSSEKKVSGSFLGPDGAVVSDVFENQNKDARAYIYTVNNVSFLKVEEVK